MTEVDTGDSGLGDIWDERIAGALRFARERLTGDYDVDEFGFDRHLTEGMFLPMLRPLYRTWFRTEVEGVENLPKEGCWKSEDIVLGTFFGGGLRAFDVSQPYQPKEVGYFVPHVAEAQNGRCQINDVFVDDRGIVFCVDRHAGGLYALEMDF